MSWQPPPPPPATPKSPSFEELTLYQLLQVDPAADVTVIQYAYRHLAATYHPDNLETANTEKFKHITEAWRTLSDTNRRNAYDIQLGVGVRPAGARQAPSGATQKTAAETKPSVPLSDVELRLAILQVLLDAKRKKPQGGGATASMLLDCLDVSIRDLEYLLWYLREKHFIDREESQFTITIEGVDYLTDKLSQTVPLNVKHPSTT